MRIDSTEQRAIWYAALLAIIGQSVAIAFERNILWTCAWFCFALLFLNLVTFIPGKPRYVVQVLDVMLMVGAILLVPRWISGVTALFTLSAIFFEKKKIARGLGILFCLGAIVAQIFFGPHDAISMLVAVGASIVIYAIWEVFMFLLHRNAENEAKLDRALTASAIDAMEQRRLREELARTQATNEHNARLQERERISRDIHNQVGHTLSAATVTLDAATMLLPSDQERALEKIDVANSRVHEAITSVRSVVRTLDADDDKISLVDYMKSLEGMVREFMMDTEIKVYHNFSQIDSQERIPMQQASFLSSSLSELLTNGVKHGQATIFVVTFLHDEKNLRLKVQDNGTGWGDIETEEKKRRINRGFGLRKMIEYAEKHGGNCTIDSIDGFAVSLSLPMEE